MWAPPHSTTRFAWHRRLVLGVALMLAGVGCSRDPVPAAPAPTATESTQATESAPPPPQDEAAGAEAPATSDPRIGPEHLRYWTM